MIRCDYFERGVCRSCTEIRVDYAEQLRKKVEHARTALARLGDQAAPCEWAPAVPSELSGFRNRAKMVVTGTAEAPQLGILGDEFGGVDLTECLLCAPEIRESFPAIREFISRAKIPPYGVAARRGELKYVLVTLGMAGQLMVRFVLRTDEAVVRIRKHLAWFRERLPEALVVSVNLQPQPSAVVEGEVEIVLTPESALRMSLGNRPILLPPGGFFQTNTAVAARLYELASDWAGEVGPSVLLDLYCGVGGFALHAAARLSSSVDSVRGVELHPEAVACANESAELWGLRNVVFQTGDLTETRLLSSEDQGTSVPGPDLIVVNPPRRGIGAEIARSIEASAAGHVIYSSCNVGTLVRDVQSLPSFRLTRACVLDMFPHTTHYEIIVLLTRR